MEKNNFLECIKHLIGFIGEHKDQRIPSQDLYTGAKDSLRTAIGEQLKDQLSQVSMQIPSPLDQFEILPLIPINIDNLYFSFTNSSFFMLLTLSLVLLLVHLVTKKGGGNSERSICMYDGSIVWNSH